MISDIEMGTVNGEVVPNKGGSAPGAAAAAGQAGQGQGQGQVQGQPPGSIDELQGHGRAAHDHAVHGALQGPTPNKIYRAQIITTGDLVSLLKKDKNLILVDTSGLKDTLPIGYSLPDAGSDGSVTDGLQADLDAWLMKKTGGKRDQPIGSWARA